MNSGVNEIEEGEKEEHVEQLEDKKQLQGTPMNDVNEETFTPQVCCILCTSLWIFVELSFGESLLFVVLKLKLNYGQKKN